MRDYNNLIFEKYLEKSLVSKFFYNLVTTPKPDIKQVQDRELIFWGVKYFIGLYYFRLLFSLGTKYHNLIFFLTRYPPFSLLFQDRPFHYQNKELIRFLRNLELLADRNKIPIFIFYGVPDNIMYEFQFLPLFNSSDSNLRKLEQALQDKYGNIYVRKREKDFYIIIPRDNFDSILDSENR